MKKILILCWGLMFSLPAIAEEFTDTTVCEGSVIDLPRYRDGIMLWYDSLTSEVPIEESNTKYITLLHDTTFYYEHVKNGDTSERKSLTISINSPPSAAFTYSSTELKVQFEVAKKHVNYHYIWLIYEGQQKIFNGDSVEYKFKLPGDYKVVLNVQDSLGCFASDTQTIKLHPFQELRVCINQKIVISAMQDENGELYDSFGIYLDTAEKALYIGDQAYSPEFKKSIVFYITGFKNGKEIYRGGVYLSIDPLPNSAFTYTKSNLTIHFSGDTSEQHHKWIFGDGGSSELASPVHTFLKPGSYIIQHEVTSNRGCYSYTYDTVYISGTGIEEDLFFTDQELKTYPNPVSSKLNISCNLEQAGPCRIELTDMNGHLLQCFGFSGLPGENTRQIELEGLNLMKGVYMIRLITPTGLFTETIIKGL